MRVSTAARIAVAAAIACGCAKRQERHVYQPSQLQEAARVGDFFKVHMRDGALYVLDRWEVSPAGDAVDGWGEKRDLNRDVVETGMFHIAVADVALIETNQLVTSPAVAALVVMSAVSLGVTAACIANPKMCFGSCPTFFV